MTTAQPSSRSRRWVTRSLLVVCLLGVYNVNLRQVSSLDTYASRLVPIALLRHGELTLDRFFPDKAGDFPDEYLSTYLYRTGGHLYDSHPPVGSLLALPIYAIPVWLGVPADTDTVGNLMSKLSASVFMALAALILVVALSKIGRRVALPDAADSILRRWRWEPSSSSRWGRPSGQPGARPSGAIRQRYWAMRSRCGASSVASVRSRG